jgi:uncharacterized protein YabE (DUF348 family)
MMTLPRRPPLAAALGLLLLAVLLAAAYLGTRKTIHIQIDGQSHTVATHAATVAAALDETGVRLDPADAVQPPLDAALQAGDTIRVARAPLVSAVANGQIHLLRTQASTPADVLASLNLTLGPGDALWADGRPLADPQAAAETGPWHVQLLRAVPFTIIEDGGPPRSVRASARTVGEALWALGYRVYAGDAITPGLEAPLSPALVVNLARSRPMWVQADGQTLVVRTRRETVGEVLAEAGVALVGEDYSVPADDQPLPPAGVIGVVRVREEVLTEQHLIPYDTVYQALPDVEIDNVYQVQPGQPGVLRRLTRIRYENGVEVSRVTDEETLVQAAQPQVIGYGTQIVIRTLATPDGTIEYWRAYEMYATSYAAKFTNRTPGTANYGRTASGKILTRGLVAIDRSLIPFGTRMYVPGYGFAEAADTGGGVRGRFIDLGFDDFNYVGWHSQVMVYFLTPAPSEGSIRWIIPSTIP